MSHDEDMSICDWLVAASDEFEAKGVPAESQEVTLTGDEPRQLLAELATRNAEAGKQDFARVLRNVIAEGNPASFIAQNEFRVGSMTVKAAIH